VSQLWLVKSLIASTKLINAGHG